MNDPNDPQPAKYASGSDSRRRLIALSLILLTALAGIVAALIWFLAPFRNDGIAIAFAVAGVFVVYGIPVCLFVIVKWLLYGEPPELSLFPLLSSRQERKFRRKLRARPRLTDDEFYDAFYAGSRIPKQLPVQLRTWLQEEIGINFAGLQPTDNLSSACGDLDWADIFDSINDDFGVAICLESIDQFDGTFDSLLKLMIASTPQAHSPRQTLHKDRSRQENAARFPWLLGKYGYERVTCFSTSIIAPKSLSTTIGRLA